MSMKKTDLEKLKGKKVGGGGPGANNRFGSGAAEPGDRREQRERDREAGLIPFACKLHGDLIREIHAKAEKNGVGLNEITAELLRKGLDAKTK
jgi:hypothetical protein